eukprot:966671-Pleurochrysis_carterae.AAC.1
MSNSSGGTIRVTCCHAREHAVATARDEGARDSNRPQLTMRGLGSVRPNLSSAGSGNLDATKASESALRCGRAYLVSCLTELACMCRFDGRMYWPSVKISTPA